MGEKLELKMSERVNQLPPYVFGRLNAIKAARRQAGEDVIDLGMGNPTDPTPERIVEKLCEAVRDPRTHRYSVSAGGMFSLKKEVAAFYQHEWGVDVDPATEVVCTIGSKEGISHLSLALMEPGELAIVPTPAFPIHVHSVRLAGGSVISIPLSNGPEFFENLRRVADCVKPTPKLLLLNFPHNPTTMTVELDFFERMIPICRERGIFVVHDFAYSHMTFDGYRAPSLLEVEGAKDMAVEFTTMSKTFNMAGWRVGFCVGHVDAVAALSRIKGYYDYGMFMPVQIASIVAMRHCREDARRQAAVYQSRRDALCDGLERIGWHVPRPKATMFAWAPIPEEYSHVGSLDFSLLLLEKANVAVAPGEAFGPGAERFVRMALVENEQRLRQAVRQIDRALRLPRAACRAHEQA